jgi:hypothetical protein
VYNEASLFSERISERRRCRCGRDEADDDVDVDADVEGGDVSEDIVWECAARC